MIIRFLEVLVFRLRIPILAGLIAFTIVMAFYAAQLRMDAGFDKQLPIGHPYIETFNEYRDRLFGGNRVIVVVRNTKGDIFNQPFMKALNDVTQDVFFLPGADRKTVTSLWTPNTRILEITEDGITARDVIPGRVTPNSMDQAALDQLRNDVIKGNLVGRLVSNDFTASMVLTELQEKKPGTDEKLDYFELAAQLEKKIRGTHEKGDIQIHIIGFAKAIGAIADGAQDVIAFFGVAFILTVLSIYLYCRHWGLTWMTVLSSLTSVVWQFGLLTVMGYGLDPLAVLVPFLVFAIGTSHGVQQLNLMTAELAYGSSGEYAARSSFSGLLIPGSLSLVTAVVGFGALYIVPIPQIQELAITAAIGTAMKIITNLVMLPLCVSFFTFSDGYPARVAAARSTRLAFVKPLGVFGRPQVALPLTVFFLVLFVFTVEESMKRHIGDLHPGAAELQPNHRYNQDSRVVAEKFSIGLDLLTVVVETPPLSCVDYSKMKYLNEFSWYMRNQPGVRDVQSTAFLAKQIAAGWNEGNLKWRALPRNTYALVQATGPIPTSSGMIDVDCTLLPIQVYLVDGKATTIAPVIEAAKQWIAQRGFKPVLSNGRYNADKIVPIELLPDGKPRREPAKATSTWSFTREQLAGLKFHSPPNLKDVPTLTLEGYGEMDAKGYPKGEPVAKVAIPLTVDAEGTANVDAISKMTGPEWSKAATYLMRDVPDGVIIRLASGNSGVAAAVNKTIHEWEAPSIILVYIAVILLTYLTYFDWRATLCCCLPLTYATFIGYWFMMELDIGLKVATLPVIVLVVGVGVDYAYYIYNRLQNHLADGLTISDAYRITILETGNGVIFTALNFALGVSTWAFSPLKFQADMGILMTFMFVVNMVMALTALPALAVTIDTLIPRTKRPYRGPEHGGRWV